MRGQAVDSFAMSRGYGRSEVLQPPLTIVLVTIRPQLKFPEKMIITTIPHTSKVMPSNIFPQSEMG
jgi:hypothetical protein